MKEHISEETFAGYMDGTLDTQDRIQVEKHMKQCDECLQTFIELWEIHQSKVRIPKSFIFNEKNIHSRRNLWHLPIRPLQVAAVFVLFIILGIIFIIEKPSLFHKQPQPKIEEQTADEQMKEKPLKPLTIEDKKTEPPERKRTKKGVSKRLIQKEEQAKKPQEHETLGGIQAPKGKKEKGETVERADELVASKRIPTPYSQQNLKEPSVQFLQRAAAANKLGYFVKIQGDVSLKNVKNQELLKNLQKIQQSITMEIIILSNGRVQTVGFKEGISKSLEKQLKDIVLKLEFTPSEVPTRKAILIITHHPSDQ